MATETTVLMYVPEIVGSSTFQGYDPELGEDKDHTGWIPVDSASFGLNKETTAADPKGSEEATHTGTMTHVDPVTVKRSSDYSTADLLVWLANKDEKGRKKEQVLIDYVLASGRYYLRYELVGVEIVSCGLDYSDDPGDATETLVFTYDEIRIRQRPILESGDVDVGGEDVLEYIVPRST